MARRRGQSGLDLVVGAAGQGEFLDAAEQYAVRGGGRGHGARWTGRVPG